MPVSLARRGLWAIGAVLVLAVLAVAGLPLIASTQIVRDSIAHQVSAWSGYHVRLDDRPEIQVWPAFRAVLNDVTLQDWNDQDPHAAISAERVEIDLSALAALRGDVVFTKMRLIRPVLRMRQKGGNLYIPRPESWGRLARSVQTARQAAAAPNQVDRGALPADVFGVIEFVEGRIVADSADGQTNLVTSLSGTLDWPALNRQASITAKGIWRGEAISLTGYSTDPLILLGGGSAPASLSIKAAPAEVSFKGSASAAGDMFIDGQLNFSAPSLNRLAEWTHGLSLPGTSMGPVSVSARAIGDRRRLKFEGATLGFDDSVGKGLLDVSFGVAARPIIAGTLAFDKLNLQALVNAFSPFPTSAPSLDNVAARINGSGFDFDLRFSAATATYGTASLSNVAASAKMKDGLTAFDISDATAFGGTLQFGMRTDHKAEGNIVDIRLAGEEVEADKLAAVLGYQGFVPRARSAFSVMLRGTGNNGEAVLATSEGSVTATFGKGSMPGLSLDAFLKRSAGGDFFRLSTAEGEALPIDGAELKANISKGIAQIERADAHSGPYRIELDGLLPFAGRGLALYGALSAQEGADPRLKSPLRFFVGGSWTAPFIASITPHTQE